MGHNSISETDRSFKAAVSKTLHHCIMGGSWQPGWQQQGKGSRHLHPHLCFPAFLTISARMTGITQNGVMAPTAPVFPAAARMPVVGLGTWTQKKPGEVRDAVEMAIRCTGGRRAGLAAGDQKTEAVRVHKRW